MQYVSVRIMIETLRQKNVFFQHVSQPFLKMRIFLLDMRKDFLIMSNFYLPEILSEPNSQLYEQLYAHFESFCPHNENQEFAVFCFALNKQNYEPY